MKYQMPAGSKIKLVALRVDDLDSMIDFYTQIIGMTSVKRTENISYLGTSEHQVSLTLRKIDQPIERDDSANMVRFAFKFPTSSSLKRLLLHVKNLGVKLTDIQYNHNFEWIELTDPEGNHVVLFAEINGITFAADHAEQWKHDEGDVITINRFLRDEEQRLKHIPAKAELSWLELNVSDIEQSMHFYHDLIGMEDISVNNQDTKTLVMPEDHSQQIILTQQPDIDEHDYEVLGVDYISFKMVRARDVDELYNVISSDKSAAHYDQIDHLLFLNDPDQINVTFSVW
ncbi:VOC family protein [Lactobacillaceae bacterium Melli_B4]